MNPPVVVDTNIFFAALVSRHSRLRENLLAEPASRFFCPRFLFIELFKHKERISAATELAEEDLLDALNAIFARIHFIDESAIPIGTWLEARRLCRDIDEKDTPFVALSLHLNGQACLRQPRLEGGRNQNRRRGWLPDEA